MSPARPQRPCLGSPTCPNLVTSGGRCPEHRQEAERVKGSRIARGYDKDWIRLREWFVRQPENVLCRMCQAAGRTTLTTEVDHVIPFNGLRDPLRLAVSNLQGLCADCHRKKTAGRRSKMSEAASRNP